MSTALSPTVSIPSILPAMPSPIAFSEAAVLKIRDLLREENDPTLALRVFVQGGGCSGFQYGFTFDDARSEDDMEIVLSPAQEGLPAVTALLDAMSMPYLQGAAIDYKDDVNGAQFVVTNPNATSTCGCGSSFAA